MRIYFDHIAGTPLDRRVYKEMLPYLRNDFGNPSSIHTLGQDAHRAILSSRERVGMMISADPSEIIFTSSATESNNLAIKGIARALSKKGRHIISSSIEHISILHPLRRLEKDGFEVTLVPVDKSGRVNPKDVISALRNCTILISIQLANPETGTIQPISQIVRMVKNAFPHIIFHTDATCAGGRMPIDVNELGVEALSLAANQFYGPKGVGILYLKKGTRLFPEIEGGIQEGGKRAGTENVCAIVGMGKAAELVVNEMEEWNSHILKLQKRLMDGIFGNITKVYLNSPKEGCLPGIINLSFKFTEGESLLICCDMEGIYVASGSPCVSHALKASHVLTAMGILPFLIHSSIIFSLGKDNKEEEIDICLEHLPRIIERIRSISPIIK